MILLTDEEMEAIDKRYDGLDYKLSRSIGMPVYKDIGDPETANREKAKAQLKKVVAYLREHTVLGDDFLQALLEETK